MVNARLVETACLGGDTSKIAASTRSGAEAATEPLSFGTLRRLCHHYKM
jgi:hypothetical protein